MHTQVQLTMDFLQILEIFNFAVDGQAVCACGNQRLQCKIFQTSNLIQRGIPT